MSSMLLISIQDLISRSDRSNQPYLRNLLKEELQNYILEFVYNSSEFNQLIFTGGTCLRKIYGLNRLSEDLDFDYAGSFEVEDFAAGVVEYFAKKLQYPNLNFSFSSDKQTIYFKLPLLKELNLFDQGTPADIFVRTDFSKDRVGVGGTDQQLITAGPFQFFVLAYDLPTLLANKIAAFLTRVYFKGSGQPLPFKGRDVYDLYWLIQLSSKSGYSVKVNQARLMALLENQSLEEVKSAVRDKIQRLDRKYLKQDLLPLVDDQKMLNTFLDSYRDYILKYFELIF